MKAKKPKIKVVFEKFRKKEIIEAVEYKEGMEDGFVTRYGQKNKDGSYSTWMFPSSDSDIVIQVPYIKVGKENKVLVGNGHTVMKMSDGTLMSMPTKEFKKLYTKI